MPEQMSPGPIVPSSFEAARARPCKLESPNHSTTQAIGEKLAMVDSFVAIVSAIIDSTINIHDHRHDVLPAVLALKRTPSVLLPSTPKIPSARWRQPWLMHCFAISLSSRSPTGSTRAIWLASALHYRSRPCET